MMSTLGQLRSLIPVHLKYLRWLLFFLVCGVILSIPLRSWQIYYDFEYTGIQVLLLFGLLAVFFAVLLFGLEYREGSDCYLSTRPVSARLVFGEKIFLMTSYTLLCGHAAVFALGPCSHPLMSVFVGGENRNGSAVLESLPSGLFVSALYLDVAFWCASLCVLLKDPVRGFLYGLPGLFPILLLSFVVVRNLFGDVFRYLPQGTAIPSWDLSASILPITVGILLSPFLLLAWLSSVETFRRFGRFRTTFANLLGFLVALGFLGFSFWFQAVDAKTSLYGEYAQRESGDSRVLDSIVHENSVVYVESDLQSAADTCKVRVMRLDLSDPRTVPEEIAELEMPILVRRRFHAPLLLDEVFLTQNRLFLLENVARRIRIFRFEKNWMPTLLREVALDAGTASATVVSPTQIYVAENLSAKKQRFRIVDLETGDVRQTEKHPPKQQRGRFCPATNYRVDYRSFPFRVVKVLPNEEVQPVSGIPPLQKDFLIRGNRVVGEKYENRKTSRFLGRDVRLALCDLEHLESPIVSEIEIPRRFARFPRFLEKLLPVVGGMPLMVDGNLVSTFSYDFDRDFLWISFPNRRRLAIWDIRDVANPVFLGVAAHPKWARPIRVYETVLNCFESIHSANRILFRRCDGAIGYLSPSRGPIWLEFPGLKRGKGEKR